MKVQSSVMQWALMAAVVGMAVPMPDLAWAQTASSSDLNSLVSNFNTQELPAIPLLLSAVSYVVGIFLAIRGIMLLKQHAETPTQGHMPKGITSICAGGAFLALPALTKVLQGSSQLSGGGANFSDFNGVSFK